jgi:hypothetical protein
MVLLLAGFVLYVMLAVLLYKRMHAALQEQGYRSPAVLNGAAVAAFVLPFACTLLLVKSGSSDEEALWWFLALALAAPLALSLAVQVLPSRNPRVAGRRVLLFPYRQVGWMLLAGAGLSWAAAGLTSKPGLVQLGLLSAAGGLGCLEIARRAAAPDAAAVRSSDPRPPVVYLRPFRHEEETYAVLPWRWQDFWAHVSRSLLRRKSWRLFTLEEYLQKEISTRLGPFIALGNPLDIVPPEGAARTYVADVGWTSRFEEMVRAARCILMMAAISEQVVWELEQIRKMGLQQRLFVLTRPDLKQEGPGQPWGPFADALQRTGYRPPEPDPGPGAVIGFDGAGRAVVLRRDVRSAVEIVDALGGRVVPDGRPEPG